MDTLLMRMEVARMRKWISALACVLLLSGCAGTQSGKAQKSVNGETISAIVEMEGDQVRSVSIDETTQGASKKDKKENYV